MLRIVMLDLDGIQYMAGVYWGQCPTRDVVINPLHLCYWPTGMVISTDQGCIRT